MATPRTGLTTPNERLERPETESLPTLFSRLGEDVIQLVDTKLTLLKVEIKEEARAYARGAITIGVGSIIAAVGFALLNIAVAFGVSSLFSETNLSQAGKYAVGFVLTGLFYLLIGAIAVISVKNRLAKQKLVPDRTVEELRKDKQWLKNEL